jgi:hypothetical protein
VIKFIKKYRFFVLMSFAIAVEVCANVFNINKLHFVGTVFFLLAILSVSIK